MVRIPVSVVLLLGLATTCQSDGGPSGPIGLALDTHGPIQTDRLQYDLEQTDWVWQTAIAFTYPNPRDATLYFVHCNGGYEFELEKLVNGAWVVGWAPILPACLSIPPLRVEASGTFADTLGIIAGRPEVNLYPKFEFDDPEGVYRLVLHPVTSFDPNTLPFGPGLPLSERVSNNFRIAIAGE